jgi:23S rRNA pseudouridine1911/1915/1917 synthase
MNRLYVEEDGKGRRADSFLAFHTRYSRERVKKMFASGEVLIEGERRKPSYTLKLGEAVDYEPQPDQEIIALPEDFDVPIVYEDEDVAVVEKGQGICVHPSNPGEGHTLVNALLSRMPLAASGGQDRPGVVHRLDKDTSGILVFAKTDEAFLYLQQQFADHSTLRRYHAIVHGNFSNRFGIIETPYGKDPSNRLKMAVLLESSRSAHTEYEVLEQFDGYSHLALRLKTGRTHQIRVHMAYIGHPVVGDKRYGKDTELDAAYEGQLLHAAELGFVHPNTGESMFFESPIPERFWPLLHLA